MENTSNAKETVDNVRKTRIQKLADIADKGINPFKYTFNKNINAKTLHEKYENLEAGAETEDFYAVAGRIVAIRNSGMFMDLQDDSGKVQLFCHKDNMGQDKFKELKLLDIGDIIGCIGSVRRTPRGELSLKATEVTLLTKSLRALPEKFHGLTDVETRYRQR